VTIAKRALAALAAFLVVAVIALAIALPRIAASDGVRARLVEAVQEATRREFTVAEISAGLFPPHLALAEPVLAGDAEGPSASARKAKLRLAILPLLARVVVVRSLVLEGASVHAVRDDAGWRLAGTDLPEEPEPERTDAPSDSDDGDDGFSFAVQRVVLEDAAVRIDDRTRTPAPRLELREVTVDVRGTAPDSPIDAELRATFAAGGTIAVEAEGKQAGPWDAKIELREVALAPLAAYAPDAELPARIGGTIEVGGAAAQPDRLKLALEIAEGFRFGALAASGPVSLTADLAGDLRAPQGPFALDASQAELTVGSGFRKARGMPAKAAGRLRRERTQGAATLRLEAVDLALARIAARAEIELAPRREITIDAAPFAAEALAELVPALEGKELGGKVGLDSLRIELDPLAVHGRIALAPLAWKPESDAPTELRGTLEGKGEKIAGGDLVLSLGGESGPATLRLLDLDGAPRFAATAKLEKADSSAVVAAFGGPRDRLSGPLDLDASLSGPLAGGDALLAALEGDVAMRIAPGRLRKVSLLREAFALAGGVQLARGKAGDADELRKYGGDEFESLSGRFHIAKGVARTDDLELDYEGYTAELRGSVGLADRALDLHGALELDRPQNGRRTVPLASVTGTIDEPQVALTPEALAGAAAAYAGDERRREKWEKKLDKRLGDGKGKDVLQALDKMLQGMSEPKGDAPDVGTEPKPEKGE
jgi:uncharacterized protein involved in outer membrane biogenesis